MIASLNIRLRLRLRCASAIFALLPALLSAGAAPAAPPRTALRVETVAAGLDHPWSLAFLPDGRMLVTERPGRLLLIQQNGRRTRVAGTPAVFNQKQAGLLEVSLHPDFARNRLAYLTFVEGGRGTNRLRLARARLDGNQLTGMQVLWTGPSKRTAVNAGGRMLWLPDGTLVLSVGDGWDHREHAHRLDSLFGKLIRLDQDGRAPSTNPYVGRAGARPEIWSWGHRHVQGLAFDAGSGRLYAHEHGPRGGDELNLIRRGADYGWPVATYGRDYSGAVISPYQAAPGVTPPLLHWTPSIAPSGLAVYAGGKFPDWRGDLLVTALAGRQVRRVDLDSAGRARGQEVLALGIDDRFRDVRSGPDGAVWLLTDGPDAKLLRVTPRR